MDFTESSLQVIHLPEPLLAFGHEQKSDHPKDGLFLYGPNSHVLSRKEVTAGVVGTPDGVAMLRKWIGRLHTKVEVPPPGPREKTERLHLTDFPGMENTFGIKIGADCLVEYPIDKEKIEFSTSLENHHEAVARTVDLYTDVVGRHAKNEERPVDIWFFVLPEIVFERCKRQSSRRDVDLSAGEYVRAQKARSDLPLLTEVIDSAREDVFDDIPDFHRQAKAKLLQLGAPSQLVRETTLAPEEFLNIIGRQKRDTQEPATVAWNLATGIYYKTQANPPWKIASMRPGVCYVGLVFKVLPNDPDHNACCAAQMFLSEGDGVVFRGANGPWKTSEWEFHLKKDAAKALIKTVLDTYRDRFGDFPNELFIHGRSKFSQEEWAAFEEVAPVTTNIVGVRIKKTTGDMKLFRDGDYPCIRGTALLLDEKNAYLWTSGYLPRLNTYIGPETPNPLNITLLRSTGEVPVLADVLSDIMGLTKINYNACNYSDSLPVTIRFADKVGDVLVMGSAEGAEKQPFKFYI